MATLGNYFLCGVCRVSCTGYKAVNCEKCVKLLHKNCEQLSELDFNFLRNCTLPYICSSCCKNDVGTFDYDQSLSRLGSAIQSGCLEMGVRMETIFMRGQHKRMPSGEGVRFNHTMSIDKVATHLAGKTGDYVPASVRGDGNGLFNAISMAIQGDEKLASEIRVRTCLEMYHHKSYYINKHKVDCIDFVSPPYEQAVQECGQNFHFSSCWTMHAAASVVSRCIRSLYPAVNGICDTSFPVLNCYFNPRALGSKHTISILWSSESKHSRGIWVPNRFVPMLPLSLEKPSQASSKVSAPLSILAHPSAKITHTLPSSTEETEHLLSLKNTSNSSHTPVKSELSKQKDLAVGVKDCSDKPCRPSGKRRATDDRQNEDTKRRGTESDHVSQGHNLADDMQKIYELVESGNSLVKSIIHEKGKAPGLVLYTDDQIDDMKALCCNGQTVLGVSKPVHLCGVTVTTTYFTQIRVTRKSSRSNNHPVFLGPLFIHGDTDFESYCQFFNHLTIKLFDTDKSKLVFSSHWDASLVEAISTFFPGLKHIKKQKSFNHVMKLAADGKGLLHLVNSLYITIRAQYAELKRSILLWVGEYYPADTHKHFSSSHTLWVSMTREERDRHYKRFLEYIPEC